MSKLKTFLASINANKLIEELKKDPATLNINDEVLPNHLEDLLETLKGDDTVKTLKIESSVWNSASLLSHNGITEESKIELLKAIPKMNLNALGLTGLTLNNSDIDIFCEAIKHSKINELEFFLGREISDESKAKLFTSIKNNKALLNCLVTGPNDMSSQEKQEKKAWTSQINERTDKNQSILEEVAQVLKDWSETPNDLHKGTIHSYLKLYQKLNKDSVIEELEKLKVTDANFILENADKHINEHFFEMVGIAKEVYADGLFVPTDITSYIASCIGDLSNIINKSSDIES